MRNSLKSAKAHHEPCTARIGQSQSHPRQPARTPPRRLTKHPTAQTGAEAQRPTARLRADWRGYKVWGRWGWGCFRNWLGST